MSVQTVREAMAAALNGMTGLRCHSDGFMRDQVNPPEAMIDYEVDYDLTFQRGADNHTFVIMIFDRRSSERAAQKRFDNWRDGTSATSVKYVIDNNAGLAAVCDYARVISASRPQAITVGVVDYLMVEFQVEVVF